MSMDMRQEGKKLIVSLNGRLDTNTTPQVEEKLNTMISGITELVFDFSGLSYISSVGLRALLKAEKVLNGHGKMIIKGANDDIIEIFELTGLIDVLNIE